MNAPLSRRARILIFIGLVASVLLVAVVVLSPNARSVQRAKEAVLHEDLWILRDSIRQFEKDHRKKPQSLQDLVSGGYIRSVPIDPLTHSAETWLLKRAADGSGIIEVRSGSQGISRDGTRYSSW